MVRSSPFKLLTLMTLLPDAAPLLQSDLLDGKSLGARFNCDCWWRYYSKNFIIQVEYSFFNGPSSQNKASLWNSECALLEYELLSVICEWVSLFKNSAGNFYYCSLPHDTLQADARASVTFLQGGVSTGYFNAVVGLLFDSFIFFQHDVLIVDSSFLFFVFSSSSQLVVFLPVLHCLFPYFYWKLKKFWLAILIQM